MPKAATIQARLEAIARERALTEQESIALEGALQRAGLAKAQLRFTFTPDLVTHTRRGRPRRHRGPSWQQLDALSRTRPLTAAESRRLERLLYEKG